MNIILEILFSFNLVINTNSTKTKFTNYETNFSNLGLSLVNSKRSEARKEKQNRHKAHKRKKRMLGQCETESLQSNYQARISESAGCRQLYNERNAYSGSSKQT